MGRSWTITAKQLKKFVPVNIRVKVGIEDKTLKDLIVVATEQ